MNDDERRDRVLEALVDPHWTLYREMADFQQFVDTYVSVSVGLIDIAAKEAMEIARERRLAIEALRRPQKLRVYVSVDEESADEPIGVVCTACRDEIPGEDDGRELTLDGDPFGEFQDEPCMVCSDAPRVTNASYTGYSQGE
jgi:hypothetical protein